MDGASAAISLPLEFSPKKTWEGYLAGIGMGILSGAGLALLWGIGAGPLAGLNAKSGTIIGCVVGTIAPIGDLGVSMFKRQFGEKDTGALLPGHGGALDRIDTWLWSAVIGYFLATIFNEHRMNYKLEGVSA